MAKAGDASSWHRRRATALLFAQKHGTILDVSVITSFLNKKAGLVLMFVTIQFVGVISDSHNPHHQNFIAFLIIIINICEFDFKSLSAT